MSDLLRAATVLFIPIALVTNIALVYPLVSDWLGRRKEARRRAETTR